MPVDSKSSTTFTINIYYTEMVLTQGHKYGSRSEYLIHYYKENCLQKKYINSNYYACEDKLQLSIKQLPLNRCFLWVNFLIVLNAVLKTLRLLS